MTAVWVPSTVDCACKTWAIGSKYDYAAQRLGNGHHPRCKQFIPHVGAADLLRDLIAGIEQWAANEDGVPDFMWDAYARAVWLQRGQLVTRDKPANNPAEAIENDTMSAG